MMMPMKRARQSLERSEFSNNQSDDDEDDEFDNEMPLSQTDNLAFESQPDPRQFENPTGLKFIRKEKRLHDRIHGQMSFEPLLVRVMDTREFQRLRNLKQLGGSVFVFPDASHSRFEHSLGVAHLSSLLVQQLKMKQEKSPELCQGGLINHRDVTCVSLAGLVHDLGHGPFSHMFEMFVNRSRDELGEEKFEHEEMSMKILRHLLTRNGILLNDYMGTTEEEAAEDLEFALALIHGLKPGEPMDPKTGRPEDKRFLFEIVSNQRNGIDVDKIDYFLRDSSAAFGESSPLIHVTRFIESCSVRELPNGETTVAYEEKMAMDLFGLFRIRCSLHSTLYQHHVVNVVEEMITDALMAASGVELVRGSNGQKFDLLGATRDVEAYVNLGDWVLEFIEASFDDKFAESQRIIERLRVRKLYDQVGIPVVRRSASMSSAHVASLILDQCAAQGDEVSSNQLLVHEVKINFGKNPVTGKAGYPLQGVYFFNPKDPTLKTFQVEESRISNLELPKSYEEIKLWIYVRDPEIKNAVSNAWSVVSRELLRDLKASENVSMQNSPAKPFQSVQRQQLSSNNRRSLEMPMGSISETMRE